MKIKKGMVLEQLTKVKSELIYPQNIKIGKDISCNRFISPPSTEKIVSSSNVNIQITENLNISEDNNSSPKSLSEIVYDLCIMCYEEISKGKKPKSILDMLDEFLVKTKQKPDDIIKWCLMNQINPMIQCIIGHCYYFGKWVEKDDREAFIHYQKSSEMRNTYGMNNLGSCYQNGIGVEKDERKAFIFYQKSADMGDIGGIINLGHCYAKGIGVEKDKHKASIYYKKAALCQEGSNWSIRFEFFMKLAEVGDINAIFEVGKCHQDGVGVKKNKFEAFLWYKKSADMGHADGMFQVGYCYQNGVGVTTNKVEAFRWYMKSAEKGNINGMFQVGYSYLNRSEVERYENKSHYALKAFEWFMKSAKGGLSIGQTQVGLCYRNGIGTTENQTEAIIWLQKANENNDKHNQIPYKCGNSYVDDFLKKALEENEYPLSWIPYSELAIMKKIGEGGFAIVYLALWEHDSNFTDEVALKLLHGSRHNPEKLLNELKIYYEIGCRNPTMLRCHGISRDEGATNDFILVMQYAKMGSLRQNIRAIRSMEWNEKLNILYYIAKDLDILHSNNIIHRDLHSGNILQNESHTAYICDFGLAESVNKALTMPDKTYGVLPYIAPELLYEKGKNYTKQSDIYSLGIIMTEMFTGYLPYHNTPHDNELATRICLGLRPKIRCEIPQLLLYLMNKCLDAKPQDRPTAKKLAQALKQYRKDADIVGTELFNQIKALENPAKKLSTYDQTRLNCYTHKQAIYISRPLDFQKHQELVDVGGSKPISSFEIPNS